MQIASFNETEEEYDLSPEKYENIIQKGIQIIDSMNALTYKNITFTEEAHFSEFFTNFQELVMTTENFVMSTSHHMDIEDFLMNTLEHYLKLFDVHLDNPGQAIQLIRYTKSLTTIEINELQN